MYIHCLKLGVAQDPYTAHDDLVLYPEWRQRRCLGVYSDLTRFRSVTRLPGIYLKRPDSMES